MAAELGLLSLTQLQKLAEQQQLGTGVWQWAGNRRAVEEDDSWEVRAFAEDTGSALGTTWPPRSYTCAFCRSEFRSAQALGGHMNVHRRDRARLRQGSDPSPSSVTPSPPILLSSPEFVTANGGLCLFYPIAPHGTVLAPAIDSSSTLLSVAPYATGNGLVSPPMAINFPSVVHGDASPSPSDNLDSMRRDGEVVKDNKDGVVVEELDLELRLGW